jgi:transcriptional regulator with XRE-family HTH domain
MATRPASSFNSILGVRLAAAREFRLLSTSELAARSGVRVARIRRAESGGGMTADDLIALAASLRLPVRHFLNGCALCGQISSNESIND